MKRGREEKEKWRGRGRKWRYGTGNRRDGWG